MIVEETPGNDGIQEETTPGEGQSKSSKSKKHRHHGRLKAKTLQAHDLIQIETKNAEDELA